MSQIEAGEPSPHTLNTKAANSKTISGTGEGAKQRSETKASAGAGAPPSFSSQQSLIRSFSEANVSELKQILSRSDADYGAYAPGAQGGGGAEDERSGSRLHPVAESLFFALSECADIQVPRYLTEVVSFFCEHLRDEVERDVFVEVDNITHALKESCRGNPTNWLKSCAQSLVLLGNIMQTVAGVDEEGAEEGVTDDDNEDDDDDDEAAETQESSTAEADDEPHRQVVTVDADKKQ